MGPLTVVECGDGPLVIEFAVRAARGTWEEELRRRQPGVIISRGPCRGTTEWLSAYFRGAPRPSPYPEYLRDWFPPEPAADVVWRALCDIPFGETRSYGQIGRETGLHQRRVGGLNRANHLAIYIPCHRVVGASGRLVGYGGGLHRKTWLLAHETRSVGLVLRSQ